MNTAIQSIRWYATLQISLSAMYWKEGDVRGASCPLLNTRDGHGRARAYEWGGADGQIVPAGPATDVMDDENDKVSQDVVGVPLSSGIHEFQWSQPWRGSQWSAMQCTNVTEGARWSPGHVSLTCPRPHTSHSLSPRIPHKLSSVLTSSPPHIFLPLIEIFLENSHWAVSDVLSLI